MSFHPSSVRLVSSALALAVCMSVAHAATPALAPYPAPGGNTAAASGLPANAGGRTIIYSAFNPTAYTDLYYAIGDYTGSGFVPGAPSLTMNSSTDVLAFNAALSNLAGGQAVWTGSTHALTEHGAETVYTRFTLSVTNATDQALSLLSPASVGLPASLGAALHVQGAFKANWRFEAASNPGGSFYAANAYFDQIPQKSPFYQVQSSVGGAFYATPPVPEPGSLALVGAGLSVLALIRRRPRAV
jgi:hypothetical protein